MLSFNVPPFTGKEYAYIKQAVDAHKICGDGRFTRLCNDWVMKNTGVPRSAGANSATEPSPAM